jgi:MSHA biogenesis protein MshG
MAKFSYTARGANGALTSGTLEAVDQNAAAQMLFNRSVTPIDIKPQTSSNAPDDSEKADESLSFWVRNVTLEDLVIFSRQMYSLAKSGIPILRSVNGLADSTNSKRMQLALRDVAKQLERGRNLSSALNGHPHIFNQLFVSIVHVGENTGNLDQAFLQLSEYLEREQETRKQIKSATRYPMFVMIAIVIALVVMNIFVIPTFAGLFSRLGADLPAMTKFLIGMSNLFVNYWHVMLGGVIAGIFILRRYLNTERGRYRWDRLQLRVPAVGSIIERSLLARFSRSFSMMLSSGVPMTSALNLVADAVSNSYMADKIIGMRLGIEKGESLSRVSQSSGLFTPLVLQMVNVGEETGRVDELLADSAEYYEREVDYDLKSLTSKIEPILIGVVAVMVLVLALGIFTPMWDLMGAFRGR